MIGSLVCLIGSCGHNDNDFVNDDDNVGNDEPTYTADFTVVEYCPAPGQFINDKASGFHDVDTYEKALEYAQRRLDNCDYISLGAFGGYLSVKCTERISNSGGYDFSVGGNSFDSSNEPGIVWVMKDRNGNGLPDDDWYELKGSYYGKEGYERNYQVTYFRPGEGENDIRWIDSNGVEGEVKWLGAFHRQPYFPEWIKEDSYILKGSRLPSQAVQNPANGLWTNFPFEWGYADNNGEDAERVIVNDRVIQKNFFKISDAVDASGNPVSLDYIDFIKVQTAVNSEAGVIGENSTEVCGIFR